MLEAGDLSEGHGRALLAAKGQDKRLALARQAPSPRAGRVRETERKGKGRKAQAGRATPRQLHPDEEAAIGKAEDALERALGHEVRVSSGARGLTAQIRFEDLDEALALAKSLRRKSAIPRGGQTVI